MPCFWKCALLVFVHVQRAAVGTTPSIATTPATRAAGRATPTTRAAVPQRLTQLHQSRGSAQCRSRL